VALAQLSVGHFVFYRFLFACFGLLPFCFRHRPEFSAREWRILLAASFLGIPLQFLIQFYGLSQTTVSHASLMVGSSPVLLAVMATIFTGERLDRIGWIAMFGSTAGVALVVLGEGPVLHSAGGPTAKGDLLVLLAMVIAMGWILANKTLMQKHPPVTVTAYGVLSGFGMLLAIVFPMDGIPPVHGISSTVWAALIVSGLMCTAATTLLWNWGLHRVPASRAGVFLNIEPVMGSVLGVVLLGDHLGSIAWLGGAILVPSAVALTAAPHEYVAEVVLE
jgi:drug/metabolite transporter (DMT)-like permease